jgi:transketolase
MSGQTRSLREAVGSALVDLGRADQRIVVLDADVGHSTKSHLFGEEFPDRYIQVGIAEQNMVSVAAGMSACGLVPFVVCFAAFLTRRCFDQIYNSIAFPGMSVKLIGSYCGFTTYGTGASHQTFDDVAIMSTLPNITILSLGDVREVFGAMRIASEVEGPFYIRVGRIDDIEPIHTEGEKFQIGRVHAVEDGPDGAILSTGIMTAVSRKAVRRLREEGFEVALYHVPTLKPIDKDFIETLLRRYRVVCTVEDQNTTGGLGSAVNGVAVKTGMSSRILNIGIDERFGKCGSLEDLFSYFEISDSHIYKKVRSVLEG